MQHEWRELDASAIAEQVRTGSLAAADLLEAMLDDIEQRDPHHHAYITPTASRARAAAKAVDGAIANGDPVGPLAGVPIAVKDIFDMAGVATTAGMAIHQDSIADRDASVIERLEAAGAIILGKTSLTEGVYAEHRPPFSDPVNPWHADYWPGASSSGSGVAVAAGLCAAALGSETGGSIKLPSAANGITALKPTWGRVPRHGVFELAATLDHVGPMTRSVRDAALLLGVIAGPDSRDPTAAQVAVPDYVSACGEGIAGLRIGLDPRTLADKVDDETATAVEAAVKVLERAGASIVEVEIPDVSKMIWDWFPICAVQTARAHAATFPARRDEYGPALVSLLEMGHDLSGIEYQELLLRREDFRGRINALLAGIDALALPVLAFPVPSLERMAAIDDDLIAGLHRFTCPYNLSGHPGLVMPCGRNAAGLPIVFQLIGSHFDEAVLFTAGAAFQRTSDWHHARPL